MVRELHELPILKIQLNNTRGLVKFVLKVVPDTSDLEEGLIVVLRRTCVKQNLFPNTRENGPPKWLLAEEVLTGFGIVEVDEERNHLDSFQGGAGERTFLKGSEMTAKVR